MSNLDDEFAAAVETLRLEAEIAGANKDIFLELPDSDQVLFIQRGEDLKDFQLFADLPIEIRRMIWRECFPNSRSVNITPPCHVRVCHRSYCRPQTRARRYPLPITLHINSESRQETLQNYTIILWKISENERQVSQQLVFDPKRDNLYLRCCCAMGPMISDLDRKKLSRWIKFLQNAAPNAFERIERIEIRGYSTVFDTADLMLKFPDTSLERFCRVGGPAVAKEVVLGGVLQFPGLKHIKINLWIDEVEIGQRSQQKVVGEYQKEITTFLEKHKDIFASEKAPDVVVEGRVGLYWAGITDTW
ncbi:uncharacterized protein PAC_06753 [Phialocephala subalpina]|uniref:2EXR domain-containing protein n=1 Tax=Phialocephala subalpina TaxID=576137 RepID=A0A1L7WVS3_9HELO|nr:uncharacterized protein PAC_06753 [Phialocephala subalpina]